MTGATPAWGKLHESEIGSVVVERSLQFTRDRLVRYAGASGDFNPIHYRDDVARSVGLPGVLAHGMLTMGAAAQVVIDWLESVGAVSARAEDLQVRFTRPVPVDGESGATVQVSAVLTGRDPDSGTARFDLRVTVDGRTVLGKSHLVVAFA